MTAFPFSEKISRIKEPLTWTNEKVGLFVNACRELAVFHFEHSADIRFLYNKHNFDPTSILSEKDIARIPSLGVTAMKHYLLTSLAHSEAVLKLTSSGTRGQKTQIWFDTASLDRVQAMLDGLWSQLGFVSTQPTNYLMFIYDPNDAKDLGIAFTVKNQQRFAPVNDTFFAIRKNKLGDWEFRYEDLKTKLNDYVKQGYPIRFLGIPTFIHEFLERYKDEKKLVLPQESLVMTGGGWKAAEDKKVSKEVFRKKFEDMFGIPHQRISDAYGMAEHSAPYLECSAHRFHVPVYNRVLARNPMDNSVCAPGEVGLLELVTPFNAMMPNLAILSTDLGYVDESPCPCGLNAPTFTLVGRGGLAKHKGCAIHASEIVRRNP